MTPRRTALAASSPSLLMLGVCLGWWAWDRRTALADRLVDLVRIK